MELQGFSKYVFVVWFAIGRVYGFLPISFDATLNRYVQKRLSRIYTMFVGAFVVLIFPFVSTHFNNASLLEETGTKSLIANIANISQLISYLKVIYAYFMVSFKFHIFVDLCNDVKTLKKSFQENYETFQKSTKFHEQLVVFGLGQQWIKIIQFVLSSYFVVDMNRFSTTVLLVLMIPEIIASVFYTEFLFGITFLWKNGIMLRRKIEFLKARENITDLRSDLTISDELDQLAIKYNQLYKVYARFKQLFSIFMLSMLIDKFHHLTLISFYMVLWIIDLTFDLMKVVNYSLLVIGCFIIVVLVLNLLLFCETSSKCSLEVCNDIFNDTKNNKYLIIPV